MFFKAKFVNEKFQPEIVSICNKTLGIRPSLFNREVYRSLAERDLVQDISKDAFVAESAVCFEGYFFNCYYYNMSPDGTPRNRISYCTLENLKPIVKSKVKIDEHSDYIKKLEDYIINTQYGKLSQRYNSTIPVTSSNVMLNTSQLNNTTINTLHHAPASSAIWAVNNLTNNSTTVYAASQTTRQQSEQNLSQMTTNAINAALNTGINTARDAFSNVFYNNTALSPTYDGGFRYASAADEDVEVFRNDHVGPMPEVLGNEDLDYLERLLAIELDLDRG